MLTVDGYEVRERIYEGTRSFVYRGTRRADGWPVALKILRSEFPSAADTLHLRCEYDALQRAAGAPGVVKTYAFEVAVHRAVLVLEDFGATSLREWMNGAGAEAALEDRLKIAIAIADALGQLHERQIIHKDLNPSNVLYAPRTGTLKICDLDLSTVLSRETPEARGPSDIEGTLAYVSPEQTGRMNRPVDYRSDYYSLGATLYELFAGRVPFTGGDALELVHCHLAKRPVEPRLVNEGVPLPLSGIIMRLLAKTAEERYQSSYGIVADLKECLARLQKTGEVESFPIAQHDVSERFEVPRRLYGRDHELASLLAIFEAVSRAEARASLTLVSGQAGIGKSMLVNELYKPITAHRGYFTSGKYDQFQRATPYSAFGVAFRSLIKEVLGESESQLSAWRETLLHAVGPNGGVVTQLIPELELVIGEQPAPAELGPAELQNRFAMVFRSFIRVFARPAHPLTLFLDDLQWADSGSLKLIDLLLRDDEPQCLLLVGAYRDNEVDGGHPLAIMLGALERDGFTPSRIALSPLSPSDVTQMVADATVRSGDDVAQLAALIASKTEGNPLFVSEMLKAVYQDELLTFDRGTGSWRWDLREIESRGMTGNVVELMIGKLRRLPEPAQRMLMLAACIGNAFDVDTLAVIAESSPGEVFERLLPAVQGGFVNANTSAKSGGRAADPVQDDGASALRVRNFRFLHDRVQQAAYALIPDAEREILHVRVGRLLLAQGLGEHGDRFFDAVDHLNRGRVRLVTAAERRELAQLNLEAGRRARSGVAYGAALSYLEAAYSCLEPDAWEHDYEFAAAVHRELAGAAWLEGAYGRAEGLLNVMIERCRTPVEKANAHIQLVSQYTIQARYAECLATCKRGAALLGMDVPVDDTMEQNMAALGAAYAETVEKLAGRHIPSLIDVPENTDPAANTLVALFQSVMAAAFLKSPVLYALIVFKATKILLEFGPTPRTPEFFGYHGHSVSGLMGDPVSGDQFGRLALGLSERFGMADMKCRAIHILANFIAPWTHHLRESRPLNEAGYVAGLEGGDLQFAGYILIFRLYNAFYEGRPLDEVIAELPGFIGFCRKTGNHLSTDYMLGLDLVVHNLRGLTPSTTDFRTPEIDEATYLAVANERKSGMALASYPPLKAEALYLHGEPRLALEVLTESEPLIGNVMGTVSTAFHPFFTALCMAELVPDAEAAERARFRQRIASVRAQFEKWAELCPSNFAHLASFLSAEEARLDGKPLEAAESYDQAIDQAMASGFEQHAAMASERAGTLQLERGRERAARAYLAEALNGFQIRGCRRKAALLQSRYAELIGGNAADGTLSNSTSGSEPRGSSRGSGMDVASIVKATQAVSGEIVLDELLRRVMHIVIENAGAERGALIFLEGDDLFVRVSAQVMEGAGGPVVGVLSPTPIANFPSASEEIVRYVVRTREPLVLRDATREEPWARLSYVESNQPRSLLAAPVIHQGNVLGVLYLENGLTAGAFTGSRVDFLRMLSTQAAISLQNARLYESLKSRNDELARTHQSMRRFVPVEYLKLLGRKSILEIRQGDHIQLDVSILFSDIRGFTTLAESLGPDATFRFLNDYLGCIEPEIHGNHGLVNQYYGDGVMALFPTSADDALRGAAGMFRGLARFNGLQGARGIDPIQITVGVNSGTVTLGTIGGGDQLACTLTGDTVNLTSRIEGIARLFGASILVAEDSVARLREPKQFALRPVGRVLPKGKTRAVTIFEALDAAPAEVRERRLASASGMREGLAHWQRGDFGAAHDAFHLVLSRDPADPAARMYLGECERLKNGRRPQGWDGVFKLDSK